MENKKVNDLRRQKIKTWIFYVSLIIIPLTQFIIFYVAVNFNSILMSIQVNTLEGIKYGFGNFTSIFTTYWSTIQKAIGNSAIAFSVRVLIGMTGGLLFSYYIFKKMPAHNFFKVMLFLPTIVSSVCMVTVYRLFVERYYPYIMTGNANAFGLLSEESTKFGAVLAYNVWVGFGTQVLMYLGAMNNVSDGALEACKIDGANSMQEFVHVVFPGIYSTFLVFVTVNIVEFFTHQMALHTFFGFKELANDNQFTLGYYMYRLVWIAENDGGDINYPAALGVMCTLVALPFTFGVRFLMKRFGPSEE